MRPIRPYNYTNIFLLMRSSRHLAKAIVKRKENNEEIKLSTIFGWISVLIGGVFSGALSIYVVKWINGDLNQLHLALRILFAVLIAGIGFGLFELFLKLCSNAKYDELLLENMLEEEKKKTTSND